MRDRQQPCAIGYCICSSARPGELNIYKRLVKGSSQMHFTGFKPIYKRVLPLPAAAATVADFPSAAPRHHAGLCQS